MYISLYRGTATTNHYLRVSSPQYYSTSAVLIDGDLNGSTSDLTIGESLDGLEEIAIKILRYVEGERAKVEVKPPEVVPVDLGDPF